MKRDCGCHADPIVFGHTECGLGPRWIVQAEDVKLSWLEMVRRHGA